MIIASLAVAVIFAFAVVYSWGVKKYDWGRNRDWWG